MGCPNWSEICLWFTGLFVLKDVLFFLWDIFLSLIKHIKGVSTASAADVKNYERKQVVFSPTRYIMSTRYIHRKTQCRRNFREVSKTSIVPLTFPEWKNVFFNTHILFTSQWSQEFSVKVPDQWIRGENCHFEIHSSRTKITKTKTDLAQKNDSPSPPPL